MSQLHLPQIVDRAAGRTLVFDSATHIEAYVAAHPCAGDLVVASSYAGVWFYEALNLPAGASVSAQSARMGDGQGIYFDGVISVCNKIAAAKGVKPGQSTREAAALLLN